MPWQAELERQADRRFTEGRYDYTICWWLLIFGGVFGAHRFYLGRFWSGLLFFFTGGLVGIGWASDFFRLNDMVEQENLIRGPRRNY